jgi:hypothetical protein
VSRGEAIKTWLVVALLVLFPLLLGYLMLHDIGSETGSKTAPDSGMYVEPESGSPYESAPR